MTEREIVLMESETRQPVARVAEILHQLADQLVANEVWLQHGSEELRLTIPDEVVLELEVEAEHGDGGTRTSIEVEIEWLAEASPDSGQD